jgi:murein DD-endopeptidase MepM/ murein hydrolase activator NlpD
MRGHYNKSFRWGKAIAVFAFLALGLVFAFRTRADDVSQKILDLRKQIEALTKQAQQYQANVNQKHKEGDTLQNQISILNNQILKLEAQINITDKQIKSTKFEIQDLEGQIFDTQEKIDNQKEAIGELVSSMYQRDQMSLLSVLIKSPRLSDFADESERAQNLNNRLLGLVTELKTDKDKLQQDKAEMDAKKTNLEDLNKRQINQNISLSGTKDNKNTLLAQTRGQEAKYKAMLSDVETKKAKFFNELKDLEAQALRTGSFIVHITADSIPGAGSLRWPMQDFRITQGYGMTSYARAGAYGGAPHNGVDFAAAYGDPINTVGDGIVLASGFNSGWGNWVAVRHPGLGNIVSLYGHMRAPTGLANGTVLSAGAILGYEGSTGNSTGAHLHLSIYKDFFTYINPKNGQLYFNYFEGSLSPMNYLPR